MENYNESINTIEALSIGQAIRQDFINDMQITVFKKHLKKLYRLILIKAPLKLTKVALITGLAIYLKLKP